VLSETQLAELREEVAEAKEQERWFDESIAAMERSLAALAEEAADDAYLTLSDVRAAFSDETVIALKAPAGTTVEVPDPDDGMASGQRRYQLVLKSPGEPIHALLAANPS